MTGTARSSVGMDARRRKILFRAWHRGIREMDLIMGRFADHWIDRLTDQDLAEFEALLDVPDQQLLAWLTNEAGVPPAYDRPLFRRMREFVGNGGS